MVNDVTHRIAPVGEPDWLTLGQAAKYLGVAQSTIRKWSDQGRVPAFYTPGGHRRYRRTDLETFLDGVMADQLKWQHLAGATTQKLFVQLGHLARDHHVAGISQNLDNVGQRLENPVRSFVKNQGAR